MAHTSRGLNKVIMVFLPRPGRRADDKRKEKYSADRRGGLTKPIDHALMSYKICMYHFR